MEFRNCQIDFQTNNTQSRCCLLFYLILLFCFILLFMTFIILFDSMVIFRKDLDADRGINSGYSERSLDAGRRMTPGILRGA